MLINLLLIASLNLFASEVTNKPLPLTQEATLTKTGLTVQLPDVGVAKAGTMSDEIWIKGTDLLEVRAALDSELDAEAYAQEQKEDSVLKFVDEIAKESTETSYTYMYRYKVGGGTPVIAIIKVWQIGKDVYACKGITGSPQIAYTYRDICDSLRK